MGSTILVIFREALEIALILGVMLSATRGLKNRALYIGGGIIIGVIGSAIVALLADKISNFASGMGQELFNALVLWLAAMLIIWTLLWMKSHARVMVQNIRRASQDIIDGHLPYYTLSVIIALAMLREGSEIVLFSYGLLIAGQTLSSVLTGALIGAALGGLVGTLIYVGLLAISTKHVFQVTSTMLLFLAAGMAGLSMRYVVAAGYFDNLSFITWNSSAIISDDGWAGQILHGLIGYSAEPIALQVIAYIAVLIFVFLASRIIDKSFQARK